MEKTSFQHPAFLPRKTASSRQRYPFIEYVLQVNPESPRTTSCTTSQILAKAQSTARPRPASWTLPFNFFGLQDIRQNPSLAQLSTSDWHQSSLGRTSPSACESTRSPWLYRWLWRARWTLASWGRIRDGYLASTVLSCGCCTTLAPACSHASFRVGSRLCWLRWRRVGRRTRLFNFTRHRSWQTRNIPFWACSLTRPFAAACQSRLRCCSRPDLHQQEGSHGPPNFRIVFLLRSASRDTSSLGYQVA